MKEVQRDPDERLNTNEKVYMWEGKKSEECKQRGSDSKKKDTLYKRLQFACGWKEVLKVFWKVLF